MPNLFAALPDATRAEAFEILLRTPVLAVERIVSRGQATPPGEWLAQERAEWVVLLRGSAGLRFEDEAEPRAVAPGDWLEIAPRRRHRVEWTDAREPTVWLALHYVAEV